MCAFFSKSIMSLEMEEGRVRRKSKKFVEINCRKSFSFNFFPSKGGKWLLIIHTDEVYSACSSKWI